MEEYQEYSEVDNYEPYSCPNDCYENVLLTGACECPECGEVME